MLIRKYLLYISLFIPFLGSAQSREELEKQRTQLKKEIAQTQARIDANKAETKESLLQWQLLNSQVEMQNKVVSNINKDLRLLDDNIYVIQKDINRYNRILDTLKQEYAKSMVYAYKNRSSYDFLNFVFSAGDFNDAVKRVAYLRSYRDHRQRQGDNIKRMLAMRQQKVEELGTAKVAKSNTLKTQSEELKSLSKKEEEKDAIVATLKKEGSKLNSELAVKQKRMTAVKGAITSAIKKAQEEARRIALAKAAEEEKRRVAEREAEKRRQAEIAKANASKPAATGAASTPVAKAPDPKPVKTATAPKKQESVLLNSENLALNTSFVKNKGSLPWPVDNGYVVMHYGTNKLPSGRDLVTSCTTIGTSVGAPVKVLFEGTVVLVDSRMGTYNVVVQHGRYFSAYANLSSVTVSSGSKVSTSQVIGKAGAAEDGSGSVEVYLSDENHDLNPEQWMRRR